MKQCFSYKLQMTEAHCVLSQHSDRRWSYAAHTSYAVLLPTAKALHYYDYGYNKDGDCCM